MSREASPGSLRDRCRRRRPGKWLDTALSRLCEAQLLDGPTLSAKRDLTYRLRADPAAGHAALSDLFSPATARWLAPVWEACTATADETGQLTLTALLYGPLFEAAEA